jgi:membrane associated rhomboid family serine protease
MIPIKGSAPNPRTAWVTLWLITANALAFAYQVSLSAPELESLIRTWGFVPREFWTVVGSAPWSVEEWLAPIMTSMFLHGSWGHIIGNMLFLWVFGDGIENRIGSVRFLVFYLVVGVAAMMGHAFFTPGTTLPTIGASGAIAGVLGAYLLLYPTAWIVILVPIIIYPLFFRVPAILFLGFWFIQQIFFGTVASMGAVSTAQGGVAWWAHAGGFVAGVVLVKLFCIGREPPEDKNALSQLEQMRRDEQQNRWRNDDRPRLERRDDIF